MIPKRLVQHLGIESLQEARQVMVKVKLHRMAVALVGTVAVGVGMLAPWALGQQAKPGTPSPSQPMTTAAPKQTLGKIKHWAVNEFPAPRDRMQFGPGEQIDVWIDPAWDEPNEAVVSWVFALGTAYPVVGTATRLTMDFPREDTQGNFETERRDQAPVGQ